MRPNGPELLMFALIFLVAFVNVVTYGGFVDAYDPAESDVRCCAGQ